MWISAIGLNKARAHHPSVNSRRFQHGIALRARCGAAHSLEALGHVVNKLRLNKSIIGEIADGLCLPIVPPAAHRAIVANKQTMSLTDCCVSDYLSHDFHARAVHHVHDVSLRLWATTLFQLRRRL